jgi:osmotically-inducible protein OsmY
MAEMLAFEMVRGKTKGPDNALKRSIEAHLKAIGGLRRGIQIAVHDGVVSLWGTVDSLWRKAQLEDTISRIPGVLHMVTRDLRVAPSGLSDREIVRKVRSLLRIASEIDPTTLSVAVRNGIVTLAGSARDRGELERLNESIKTAKGVRGMENLVTISRSQKEKDHIVSRRINRVLSRLYPRKDVSTSVFAGVAVLSGQVDRLKAKIDIEEIVRRDRGVERVINKITIR